MCIVPRYRYICGHAFPGTLSDPNFQLCPLAMMRGLIPCNPPQYYTRHYTGLAQCPICEQQAARQAARDRLLTSRAPTSYFDLTPLQRRNGLAPAYVRPGEYHRDGDGSFNPVADFRQRQRASTSSGGDSGPSREALVRARLLMEAARARAAAPPPAPQRRQRAATGTRRVAAPNSLLASLRMGLNRFRPELEGESGELFEDDEAENLDWLLGRRRY